MLDNSFKRGQADMTLFIKKSSRHLLITYIDEIVSGAIHDSPYHEFDKEINAEFEMSMINDLHFFHDMQIK